MRIFHLLKTNESKSMLKRLFFFFFILSTAAFAQSELESSDFSYPLKLYNQKFYDLAAQQFIKFYTNYPNSSKADQAHYFAGMAFFKSEDYNKARIEFQSLAVGFPKSDKAAEGWLKTGICSEYLGEEQEAAKSYETIRLLYPKKPLAAEGLYKAGTLFIKLEQYNKAFQVFSVVLEQYTGSSFYIPSLVKSALSLFYQDEMDKAEQLILKALNTQADNEALAEANLIAAKIKISQGYQTAAKTNFNHILKNYPKSAVKQEALFELSKLYLSENELSKAQKLLNSALADEEDKKTRHLLGDIYYLQNQFSKAQKEYDAIAALPEDNYYLAIQLKKALCLRHLNNKDVARTVLEKALDKATDKSGFMYTATDSIYLDWLETDAQYTKAISILNSRQGKSGNAVSAALIRIRLARILVKSDRWRDVIPVLRPLTLLQENISQKDKIFFYLAQAYQETENFQESVFYYQKLISDFAGSVYYSESLEQLNFLLDYKIINKDVVVEKLADITAKMVTGVHKSELQYKLGKLYLDDLKKPLKAEQQFSTALQESSGFTGNIHLFLGKAYLMQSYLLNDEVSVAGELSGKASNQFKLAIKNTATNSAPDEASWLLVQIAINQDTVKIGRQKIFLETLIQKYPDSPLTEDWYKNLACILAFDSGYVKESLKYFKLLTEKFPASKQYPDYLFAFARLLNHSNTEQALIYYKRIASEYPYSHPASEALYQVANDYQQKKMYKEAQQLFTKLVTQYYYTSQAKEADARMGLLLVNGNEFDKAAAYLKSVSQSPFLSDPIFSMEFCSDVKFDQIYLYARAMEGIGDKQQGILNYKRYLKLSANGQYVDEARFNLAEIYFSLNKLNAAADNFKVVSEKNSALYYQARMYLAQIYFKQGNYQTAASAYNKLQLMPMDPEKAQEVSAKYIVSLIRAGKINDSKNAIKKYKKQFPKQKNNSARFIVELADFQRKNKNYTKAIKLLKEVKQKYKASDYLDDADYSLAVINVTLNKVEDAFKILSKFYNNYPNSNKLAAALNTLGNLYFRTEKYDNAITMFKNALKANPDREMEANISSNLIKTYALTGFWDAAQALARQYVDKFPNQPDLLDKKIIIAQSYINLNQFQNGVDYLKKIKLESDAEREPEIQFYIGEALLKGGQYENAIAEFVKIPLLSKKTKLQWEASALYYSGQSYEKLGRTDDAIRMYKEIMKRPGIDLILKKEAEKRIKQIQ